MMYLYQSDCREGPFFLSLPGLERCPFCMEKHLHIRESLQETNLDQKLRALSNAAELEDICILNTSPDSSIWFFVYIGHDNFRAMGYADNHDTAVEIMLALGFSGKRNRMIDSWGDRMLCGEDFQKLVEDWDENIRVGS